MELFCEYTERLTSFAIKAPSQMFDWVIYRPPKILAKAVKLEEIIAIVTTHNVFLFSKLKGLL